LIATLLCAGRNSAVLTCESIEVITTTSKRIAAATLALLIAAQLSGCSDSDNGPRTQTPAPTNPNPGNPGGENPGGENPGGEDPIGTPGAKQGVFVDSPVAGLSYTTSSDLSGVTDDQGRYEYNEGDTVTFSIGELVLGTVAAPEITRSAVEDVRRAPP